MKKFFLCCLTLTFLFLGCAAPQPPSPLESLRIMKTKELQTRLLNETVGSLRKSLEDQYLKWVEDMSEGVVLTTMFGDILEANRAYQNMLGYTLSELRDYPFLPGRPVHWRAMEEQKITEAMTRDYVHFKKAQVKKDGALLSTEIMAWIIKDRNDNPIGIGILITPLP